jgi:hypothetical protein
VTSSAGVPVWLRIRHITAVLAVAMAPLDRALATTVVNRIFEGPAFALVLAPFILFYVGLAAFAVLLLVRRVVALWIPVTILLAIPIELFGPMLWKARLFFALLSAAFMGLAWSVWRVAPSEWDTFVSYPRTAGNAELRA